MLAKFIVLLTIAVSSCLLDVSNATIGRRTPDIVRKRGFDVEEYDVLSVGYVLKVYRIVNPLADRKTVHKVPVIFGHGVMWDNGNMMAASANSRPRKPKLNERVTLYAMENGTTDDGIHFYMSNNNYDVWLFDSRGTSDLDMPEGSPNAHKKNYWDFSLDDQALVDLPKQIAFVQNKTGSKKVGYVAYSQSAMIMFMLLSMKPEFSENLAAFVAMAPVVYTSHIKSISYSVTKLGSLISPASAVPAWASTLRLGVNAYLNNVCSISIFKYSFCRFIYKKVAGTDHGAKLEGGLTEDPIKLTSMKASEQIMHNADIKDFRMFDYKDDMLNMEAYGQTVPPMYNISRINFPYISLFRGTADTLSDPEDQMYMLNKLKVPIYEDHILEGYSHIEFVASPTVVKDVNEPILRILDTLTNRPVEKISHTLGHPNPQVEGLELEMTAQREQELLRGTRRRIIRV